MPYRPRLVCLVAAALCALPLAAAAQDDPAQRIDPARLPPAAFEPVDVINVRGADLRDVVRSIAAASGLSIVVDDALERRVTLALENVTALDALRFLVRTYDLQVEQSGAILRLYGRPPPPPEPPPEPRLESTTTDGQVRLSADLAGVDVRAAARLVTQRTGVNVVVPQGVGGTVTAYLEELPLEEALSALFEASGFTVARSGSVVTLGRAAGAEGGASFPTAFAAQGLSVSGAGLVDLSVQGAPAYGLARALADTLGYDLVVYDAPAHSVTLQARGLSPVQALDLLFAPSESTYRLEGDLLTLGRRDNPALAGPRLIRLDHLRADVAFELIPPELQQSLQVQLVREHNGVVAQGPAEGVNELRRFLGAIDQPTPLILIEALVVDYDESATRELGISFGRGAADSAFVAGSYGLDLTAGSGGGTLDVGPGGVRRALQFGSDLFGLGSVGRLPSDFYARVRALEAQGQARVLSRPQVSTLSGYPALISVGTTQYYILRTTTPVTGGGGFVPFESERFEQVEANVQVEVTPWVSASGGVIATVRPEFQTPVGQLSSAVPPTINSRVLEATVRLQDGETIILGGLIQESEVEEASGVPLLSRIPLIGRLFRGSRTVTRTSELVVYLTPHVFYGDGTDAGGWLERRERLRFRPDGTRREDR